MLTWLHALLKHSRPSSKRLIRYTVDQLPGFPVRVWAKFSQLVHRFSHAAAAGGGKGHQRLARKIVAFHKSLDNVR